MAIRGPHAGGDLPIVPTRGLASRRRQLLDERARETSSRRCRPCLSAGSEEAAGNSREPAAVGTPGK